MKKFLSLVIAMAMLATMALAAVPSDFSDIPNDWSKTAIENAINNGLLNGSNGKINAGSNLTRAEMCAIITRAAKAQYAASISFTDVASANWFYNEVAKAVGMEVFNGDGKTARPNAPITREETMAIVARFLKLDNVNTAAELGKFSDAANVSNWAKDNVAAMINSGYIQGSNGKINPKMNITRKEFAAIMDRVVTTYISDKNAVTKDLTNTMINTIGGGVTLSNMTINGDLIIGDGVGTGIITLNNVKVTGRLLVRGGKEVNFTGGSVNKITVASDNSTVNISATTTYTEANGKVLDDAIDSKIVVAKPASSGGGGGGGAPATKNPEELISYKMTVAGSEVEGVVTGDATNGYTVNVDLSTKNADDYITTGIADTKYGSDLKIGGKTVKTDVDVSVYDLFVAIGLRSEILNSLDGNSDIQVGVADLILGDIVTYVNKNTNDNVTTLDDVVKEVEEGKYEIYATMTHDGKPTNVTFVFEF